MRKIFLGVVVYALAELALLIVIGQNIGVFSTLMLIVATSVIGIYVMKNKGMNSIQNVKNTMARGEAPGAALVDTLLTFGGGLFLALPGFLTDLVGLLLLMPFSRKMFQPIVYYWMRKKMKKGQFIIVQR
ncbi:FxsA family protein [Lysinibacillus irui]|uniref:FxsA family protein n=1 Tax=Lysinibacillus irui TaxID=2998077 RepID=A0AAJ5RQK1_9BACI|nr:MULTISPECIES: FxsA family protein [Lysinibacillus]MEA0555520.1 FxsA family protein [Lysinibacillus irui]MEA0564904.1 FxsA family protein [Lysinibacillus irui]MEA0977105.1 FxsA family protein [Lysinibacillus irui]MEA1043259.1 FxsA family protein [Lysinibacillus irui]WDV05869.1 FxsA family protein [Lysinibacillus irui]